MQQQIKHRRLHAFLESNTLASLVVIIDVCLLLTVAFPRIFIPMVAIGGAAFIYAIAYSLWLWIKKPATIKINPWMSNISMWITFYFILYAAIRPESIWWSITPAAYGILVLLFNIIRPKSTPFTI